MYDPNALSAMGETIRTVRDHLTAANALGADTVTRLAFAPLPECDQQRALIRAELHLHRAAAELATATALGFSEQPMLIAEVAR